MLLFSTAGCHTISFKKSKPAPSSPVQTQPVNIHAPHPITSESLEATAPRPITHDQVLLDQAHVFVQQGDLQTALARFEQAIDENPKLVEAYIGAGLIYHGEGDYAIAEKKFERATRFAPTSFEAYYYLGLMRQLLSKFQLAVKAYLYALAINPEDFSANHNLSICYLQQGRSAEAAPYALRATRLNRNNQQTWANLGSAYNLMGIYAKAVLAYRQANELGEPTEPILLGLTEAHMRLDHHSRAMIVLKQVLKKFPSAIAHERMGYALFKTRKYDQAMEQFRAALLFDPDDTASLNGFGVCLMTKYIQNGRSVQLHWDQALVAWRKSLKIQSNQPQITALLQSFGQS